MAETFKAVTRFKTGTKEDGFDYVERGETVSQSDLDATDEQWAAYQADELVLPSKVFDERFPGDASDEGANQPAGTPSNLADVEGTKLAANPEEAGSAGDSSSKSDSKSSGTNK